MTGGGAATPAPGSSNGLRYANIDVLRGLAALLVIWQHAAEVFIVLPGVAAHGTGWADSAELLGAGRIGVIAFFAISGYVIVPTVAGARAPTTRAFVVKRFFRLFPPFWASMALAVFTVWHLFDKDVTPASIVANATMVPLEFGQPMLMGHYWTLEVELIFYVLVVALFWRGALRDEATTAWLCVGLTVAWAVLFRSAYGRLIVDRNLVWSFLSYFLTVMFWGAMVRRRHDRAPGDADRARWPFVVVTALVFGRPLIALLFGSPTVHREDWRGTMLGLLLFLAATRVPDRWVRRFVWLGTISYSLYLFHPAVFYPLYRWVRMQDAARQSPLWMYVAASIAASVAVASLAYRVVEAPANRLARRLVAYANDPRSLPAGRTDR